jgi:hypothetical protein
MASGGRTGGVRRADWHTDQGPHTFDFILCVGERLEEARLHTAARQQRQPSVVFDRYVDVCRPPWGGSPSRALWLDAVERALADGRVSHLWGSEETSTVRPSSIGANGTRIGRNRGWRISPER